MATVVSSLPKGRPGIYPWAEWIDGQARIAHRYFDFNCTPANFRIQLFQRARIERIRVKTSIDDDGDVWFQFFPQRSRKH